MTPGLLRAAKGVDHEAHEGHEEEPDRSRSITWETLTWQVSGCHPSMPLGAFVFFVSFVVDRSGARLVPTL